MSRITDPIQLERIRSDLENETNEDEKRVKKENMTKIFSALTWIKHVDECLGFFSKENEQGKGIIIKGLKYDGNFFQFLTQLELGLKLKKHGFKVSLEDTSIIDKPRIDILASKNGYTIIFELVTPDMYSELKYSGFTADIPDRAKSTLFSKINEQISRYKDKTSAPIIIVFNLTRSPDSDIDGILHALKGGTVYNIIMNERAEIVDRYKTYERDSLFLKSEDAERLSAVICYNNENTYQDIRFNGEIIINDFATAKLDERTILELKNILFK